MYCCENCFKDRELKSIVGHNRIKGDCDFCSSRDVVLYDLEKDCRIKERFEALVEIYTEIDDANKAAQFKAKKMENILAEDWNIFNFDTETIKKFISELFPEKNFELPYAIIGIAYDDFLKEYSLLDCYEWEDFVKEIKEDNRFHTHKINEKILRNLVNALCKKYKKGSEFFRARIWSGTKGYTFDKMGAPPFEKASAGRVSAEGIRCLYLADSVETTLHETRAGMHDRASVATFRLQQDIEVIDLAALDSISPFAGIDMTMLAINMHHLRMISADISKPLRKHDSNLDYVPTQFICDFIKSEGFSGVEYNSVMHKNGINLAIFDERLFQCVDVKHYDITTIDYGHEPIL